MRWLTRSAGVRLRRATRALGLNRYLGRLLRTRDFERVFGTRLLESVRTGDVVWDVGAHVGRYTQLFADRVGASGRVYAFEPNRWVVERLRANCGKRPNVEVHCCALGAETGLAPFDRPRDPEATTGRIGNGDETTTVEVWAGDDLVASGAVRSPNVVKVDVEGYEWEVLKGMTGVLRECPVRVVGVELHFALLDGRGLGWAPAEMENHLSALGFDISCVGWNYLLATRTIPAA